MRLTLIALPEKPDDRKVRCIGLDKVVECDTFSSFRYQTLVEPIDLGDGRKVLAVGLVIRPAKSDAPAKEPGP